MEIAVSSVLSVSSYLAVSSELNLSSVWQELLIALGICIINSILVPLVKFLFGKIKTAVAKKQKTPENDGELADIILEGLDKAEEKLTDTLKDLTNKGVKNGKDKDGTNTEQ